MSRIEIVEPKLSWPEEFTCIAEQLRAALGELALAVDHIGSTSVLGLPAKDVIDIQVSVNELSDLSIIERLTNAGYLHISHIQSDNLVGVDDDSLELRKYFFRNKEGQRLAHIHIREAGRINQKYPILFRDFLRTEKTVADAYATVKKELATRFPNDADAYYAIKDPYMDTIYFAASLWEKTGK